MNNNKKNNKQFLKNNKKFQKISNIKINKSNK